ncbi:hypothetical protein C1645_874031 [Glomus cerebriforme]|uniref:Uncharacterized protein n=1 Tax=Glomus cerebriforme TaxID=658196 RepID=A0A397T5Z6_9GLOM|nr:hypothetical protein C1645_874031 [Glomus cerebriforme]
MGIATMWSNLKQKISDELSAHVTRIVNDFDTKNNTLKIENIFSKLTMKINTKITNELSARLSEVNSTFTAELSRINNEFTTKIAKINSRDAGYVSEVQKILLMVDNVTTRLNNIKEACHNDFGNISSEFTSIKIFIEALQNEMIQRYAIAQRLHHSSSSESSSNQLSDSALEENKSRFKQVFNSNKEVGDTIDYAFETVRREICKLTGEKIGKGTGKSFYYGEGDPKFNTVMTIMRWVDDKEITNSLCK